MLETVNLRLRLYSRENYSNRVWSERGPNGARCDEIKVRTDTTKLSDMVIASFGDG